MYQDYRNYPWPLSVRSQGKLHIHIACGCRMASQPRTRSWLGHTVRPESGEVTSFLSFAEPLNCWLVGHLLWNWICQDCKTTTDVSPRNVWLSISF
jgi:hypothetical protein